MAIISKPYTFSVGATIIAAEHNSNFDTIYNDYNGNITNANLAASFSLDDSKIGQISTYGKVTGAAITNINTLNAAAGTIPVANICPTAEAGAIPYFASASVMTSLASGTSGYYLMSTGTTSAPIYNAISTTISGLFGAWVDKSSNYGAQQATTDCLIVAVGVSAIILGYTDGNADPTTNRCYDEGSHCNFTMPVRKNDYWKVILSSGSISSVYLIAVGS